MNIKSQDVSKESKTLDKYYCERTTSDEKEIERIENFIKDLQIKIEFKDKLRSENIKCIFPAENSYSKLDSSLKKNTAFVKKLKQFTALQLDGLLRDMSALNLSKYISEICVSLAEAKLKMTDVQSVVILTSKLHQTYSDFDNQFLESWHKILCIKSGDKVTNPSKLRVDLRLFAELVSSGVINSKQGLSLLGSALTNLISQTKDDHSNLSIILSFCRHCGEEYAGLVPRHLQNLAEKYEKKIPKSNFLSPEKQNNLKILLKDYYKTLTMHLLLEHKELIATTKMFRNVMKSKGEISNEGKEKCELMQSNFDKLYNSAITLADLLNENIPELPKDHQTGSSEIVLDIIDDKFFGELNPWGDEDTKKFYIDLPDLRQFLPNFCPTQIGFIPDEEANTLTEEALDNEIEPDLLGADDIASNSSDFFHEKEDTTEAVSEENKFKTIHNIALPSQLERVNTKANFDNFLNNLNNCVNTELIDSAAIEFLLNFNTKNNRKKLTKALFGVQRTRLDLLPFLSRFVAIINIVNHDVATDLVHMLKSEFKWHIQKKNQMNIESKIKIIRFIGEMTKFGLYSKIEALFCLKILLHDFQHHQIEMACALIEVTGIYLYNCKDTRLRMNVYLEQMIRLKTNTALDSRHASQVESVYYLVKPPESLKRENFNRPVLHEYIRNLIFEELCSSNVDKIIKLIRRLDWDDSEISSYAIKCMSKAYLLRFPLIRCLADLVSGLSSYEEKAVTRVIDNVFEDVRAGLEIHAPKLAQRRIAMAKYLGELYNYKLIDSNNVLNTLYSIISLGVSTQEGILSPLDPPESLFRLKLACVLLDTSGQYFTSSISRKRLDYFLVFFQHYYWYKKSNPIFSYEVNSNDLFPILIDHMYKDCLLNVKPKLKLYKSFDQAKEEVEKLKATIYPQLLIQSKYQEVVENVECHNSLLSIREDWEWDEVVKSLVTENNTSDAYGESEEDNCRKNFNEYEEMTDNGHIELSPTNNSLEDLNKNVDEQPTVEDLEFEEMFEKVTAESYQERLRESVIPTTKDIPVPIMAKNNKKTYEQLQPGNKFVNSSNENTNSIREKTKNSISFVLMIRGSKGGKQQFKTFNAPIDSELAVNLKLQEQKIREENEKVKRLTLNITERIEEEDYQESLLQQKNQIQNRFHKTRQTKFKHQKGAPDADLIFN